MLTEDDLEQLCLGWFADQGWEIHHGPDIAPDGSNPQRANYHDVFLTPVLTSCLQKLNPHLPSDVFEQVISRITRAESPDLIASNKAFHHWLLEGVPVRKRKPSAVCSH